MVDFDIGGVELISLIFRKCIDSHWQPLLLACVPQFDTMHPSITYTVGFLEKKRVYSSKYALSSIVYCSKCGDI